MVPCSFDEANCILSAPPEMSVEDCEALNVWRGENSQELPIVVSCWRLTKEEMDELIKNGGRIWLTCAGYTMPPVQLTPQHPWGQK